jgi:uncharacterized membrane protein YdbT with pleckstrin-like domain
MGYVEDVLIKDEKVIATTKIHWMDLVVGIIFFWLLLIPLLSALSRSLSTELAVTTSRVIGKTGLIRRHAIDSMLDKVSNVRIDQGLLGRIFNYGSVEITTAGDSVMFSGIAKPNVFKAAVINQMDSYSKEKVQEQAEAIAKAMKKDQ